MNYILMALALYCQCFCAQICYTSITLTENALLDRHQIDYTGTHSRYLMTSGKINNIPIEWQESVRKDYDKFLIWNKGYFDTLPTMNEPVIIDGYGYLLTHEIDFDKNPMLFMGMNETRQIIGMFSKEVNDVKYGIKTIEIVELYNTGIPEDAVDKFIMIQDFTGKWALFSTSESRDQIIKDYKLEDCPDCSY